MTFWNINFTWLLSFISFFSWQIQWSTTDWIEKDRQGQNYTFTFNVNNVCLEWLPLQIVSWQTQLEKLQKEIAAAAKKTGISSAFKLAMITPNKEAQDQPVPDVEWWDHNILSSGTYQGLEQGQNFEDKLQGITLLVEHPIQRHPPGLIKTYKYSRTWHFYSMVLSTSYCMCRCNQSDIPSVQI